jgi:hypothetical protein
MPDKQLTSEQILALLVAAPTRITEVTAGLSPAQLRNPPAADEWSITGVLAHLRSCSDMWGDAINTILTQDKPTFKAMNPATWIKQTDYPALEFQPSFQAYTKQRADLLATLKLLPPESWSRSATVLVANHPSERTVHFYAQWLATHERTHVKQIERIAKALRT